MAPRRAKVNKFDYKKLSANDVICPLCRSILIKPITLPCSHGFCSSCFEPTTQTQNANLVCPSCRVRVGSWLRSARKSKKVINEELWQAIQSGFPHLVRSKLKAVSEISIKDKNQLANVDKTDIFAKVDQKFNSILRQKKQPNSNKEKTVNDSVKKQQNLASSTSAVVAKPNNQKTDCRNVTNNFATKEYTCRILCQNDGKEAPRIANESHKKDKRIQKIAESESQNDRSNSIESECLYFKPIDYRHNPPSEGLAPIKVPTKKPNVSTNFKILAPCGQNQININPKKSAFVHLFYNESLKNKLGTSGKKENIVAQDQTSPKRKLEQTESKHKKKIKTNHKPVNDDFNSVLNNNVRKNNNVTNKSLVSAKKLTKSIQEQTDFELAMKLQETYNQYSKYLTRSKAVKRVTPINQVRPYKVK